MSATNLTIQLQFNEHGQRFRVLTDTGTSLGQSRNHFWSSLWNGFFGWLVTMPTHDELTIDGQTLLIESKRRFMGARYRLSINQQPVAAVVTRTISYRSTDQINVRHENLQLTTGLGRAQYVLHNGAKTVLIIRQQADNADHYTLEIGDGFGLLTGIGVAIGILAGHGK